MISSFLETDNALPFMPVFRAVFNTIIYVYDIHIMYRVKKKCTVLPIVQFLVRKYAANVEQRTVSDVLFLI
jgi:hypothetical protein